MITVFWHSYDYSTLFSPQTSVPLHCRSDALSRALRRFIDEVDSSLIGGNNEVVVSTMRRQSSSDPLMPKLSPQPPNTGTFGIGSLSSSSTDNPISTGILGGTSAIVSNSQLVHHLGTAKPPCLFNSQLISTNEAVFSHLKSKSMEWDESHASTVPKVCFMVIYLNFELFYQSFDLTATSIF